MLDIDGGGYSSCDGRSRRHFLRVGSLGLAGLTLPGLLKARGESGKGARLPETAVIQVMLSGGPSHLDTYDPKPDAPRDYRGEFAAIPTAVSGISIGELLPRHARSMDRMAIVRSLCHESSDHFVGSHRVLTGFASAASEQSRNERPSVGSIAAKVRGPHISGIPPYIAMGEGGFLNGLFQDGAYLGPGFNPFRLGGDPSTDLKVPNIEPPAGLTLARLDDRRDLLAKLDQIDRRRDASGAMDGLDQFTRQAYAMVTGTAARKALDLSGEDPRLRDRYGRNRLGQSCLLARRLVESGVSFVTITDGDWDHHSQIFAECRRSVPPMDAAVSTLVDDLYDRGLADRVLVLVWGEFGRTPRISNGGRDHWPGSMSALLAGGGLKMGQVVGATNRKGEQPVDHPLRPEDVIQTVYHVLGIDSTHTFPDDSGRPMAVLNQGKPIAELI